MGEDITNMTELKELFYQTFISITIYVFLNREVRIIALCINKYYKQSSLTFTRRYSSERDVLTKQDTNICNIKRRL